MTPARPRHPMPDDVRAARAAGVCPIGVLAPGAPPDSAQSLMKTGTRTLKNSGRVPQKKNPARRRGTWSRFGIEERAN